MSSPRPYGSEARPDHDRADSDERAPGPPRLFLVVIAALVLGIALMLAVYALAQARS